MPEWKELAISPAIKNGLFTLGFSKPTDIQAQSIPRALQGRDVVGVAETVRRRLVWHLSKPSADTRRSGLQGSGKTLAYGIPILHRLLTLPPPPAAGRRPLQALILCPTRELALQVTKHLTTLVNAGFGIAPPPVDGAAVKTEAGADPVPPAPKRASGPPRVSIQSVVGGLSILKQRRLVTRGADIIVATPGRLWDLITEDEGLQAQVKRVQFLVVDEADRMIENGHFAELESIVGLTARGAAPG